MNLIRSEIVVDIDGGESALLDLCLERFEVNLSLTLRHPTDEYPALMTNGSRGAAAARTTGGASYIGRLAKACAWIPSRTRVSTDALHQAKENQHFEIISSVEIIEGLARPLDVRLSSIGTSRASSPPPLAHYDLNINNIAIANDSQTLLQGHLGY
jgi:hypothetical protein